MPILLVVPPVVRAREQEALQRRAKLEEDLRTAHVDLKDIPEKELVHWVAEEGDGTTLPYPNPNPTLTLPNLP